MGSLIECTDLLRFSSSWCYTHRMCVIPVTSLLWQWSMRLLTLVIMGNVGEGVQWRGGVCDGMTEGGQREK